MGFVAIVSSGHSKRHASSNEEEPFIGSSNYHGSLDNSYKLPTKSKTAYISKNTNSKDLMTTEVQDYLMKEKKRNDRGEMLRTCCYQSVIFFLAFVKLYFISLL